MALLTYIAGVFVDGENCKWSVLVLFSDTITVAKQSSAGGQGLYIELHILILISVVPGPVTSATRTWCS